jgi:hypothetical protein
MADILNALATGWDPAARESQLLNLQGQRAAIAQIPEDIDWQREQRRMARDRLSLQQEELTLRKATNNFTNEQATAEWALKIAPTVNYGNYPVVRDWVIKQPGGERFAPVLPDPSQFKNELDFTAWHEPFIANLQGAKRTIEKGQTDLGKTAFDMYGKTYSQLTPEEQKKVDDTIGAKKTAKTTTKTFEDDKGRVVSITFDEQGNEVGRKSLGQIGKGREPKQPSGEATVAKENAVRAEVLGDFAGHLGVDVNDVSKRMSPEQRKAYQEILGSAQRYALKMTPRDAANQALKDWHYNHPQGGTSTGGGARQRAIDWLKQNAPTHPVTDANINAVIQNQGFK